jgi:poly-gamma-glutamate capsule biosynthesis protein CapA/YwtB (metallophosphatase superfamily)
MKKQFQVEKKQSVYISGYKQKQLSCYILSHILNYAGSKVGVVTQAGIFIDGLDTDQPKIPFFKAADYFHGNSAIDTAIYEVRPRHFYKYHLKYKKCSVAGITNIDLSKMESSSLNSKERIFQAFSMLCSLSENKVVINADDEICQELIKLKGSDTFVLISLNNNNPVLLTHIKQGGSAAFIEEQQLVLYENKQRFILAAIQDLPASCTGLSGNRILFYTLFSICSAKLLGINSQLIIQSLKTLKTSAPVQLKEINDLSNKVIVFNRHNSRSIQYAPSFLKKSGIKKDCTLVCSISFYQQLKKTNHKLLGYINKCIFSDDEVDITLKKFIQYNEFQALKKAFDTANNSDELILLVAEDYNKCNTLLTADDFEQTLKDFPFTNIEQKNKNNFSMLFLGDTGFGENYQEKIAARGGNNILTTEGYEYPLVKVKDSLLKADMVFANLETPLTSLKASPYVGKKSWVHWGDVLQTPKSLLQHNIHFVTLANNHTFDYGKEGFEETLNTLERSGIHYVGAGLNPKDACRPTFINLQSTQSISQSTTLASQKIAIIGAYSWSKSTEEKFHLYANNEKGGLNPLIVEQLAEQIKTIRSIDENIFIILSLHWGNNYQWVSDRQKQLAKKLLNSGADLIIGHGAHMIQEFDKIADKWVIYSIGNFMFNSPGRYKKLKAPPYSFVADLTFKEQSQHFQKKLKLYPIVTDNRVTNYQSRYVNEVEFAALSKILSKKNSQSLQTESSIQHGINKFCYVIDL